MKRVVFVIFLVVFLGTAVIASAGMDPVFGTELEIKFTRYIYIGGRSSGRSKLNSNYCRYNYPVCSPDVKWIACSGEDGALFIVSPEGGEAELIDYHEPGNPGYYQVLCFTPDSQEITFTDYVYDADRGSYTTHYEYEGTSYSRYSNFIPIIRSINIYTGERRIIIEEGNNPSWSRDGRYLVYKHFDSRIYTDIMQAEHHGVPAIYDTITGETRFLTDDPNLDRIGYSGYSGYHNPSFSPDGSHIIVFFKRKLCRIPFEGGEPEQLTFFDYPTNQGDVYYTFPKYSPDGKWILFEYVRQDSSDIVVYDVTTGETYWAFDGSKFDPNDPRPYYIENPNHLRNIGDQMRPCWTPDGDKMCYTLGTDTTGKSKIPSCRWLIYLADFDPDRYDTNKNAPILVESEKPSGFALSGNYPNPFNPATTIDFTLSESGFTSLSIYNLAGQRVRELVSQQMFPGVHSVVWDGRDDDGKAVSTGVYISRLQTGTQITTKQMMLLK